MLCLYLYCCQISELHSYFIGKNYNLNLKTIEVKYLNHIFISSSMEDTILTKYLLLSQVVKGLVPPLLKDVSLSLERML